uniref:Uncharacterized protein n=1 Tax=Cannabis sativa TaxID=3483 RepID=A0A803Q7V3_CANSA
MAEPTLPTVNHTAHTTLVHSPTLSTPTTIISTQQRPTHSTVHCTLSSRPIMTSTVTPSTSKGKAPMYPEPSRPLSINPPSSTLHNLNTPIAPTTTRKRSFTSQSYQVGSSVRSMLKRARASHSDFVVVPSMSDNEETAGVAQQPHREK